MRRLGFYAFAVYIASIPLQKAYFEIHAYAGSIPRLVGIAAALVGLVALISTGRIRPLGRGQIIIFFYLAWAGFSIVWALSPRESAFRVPTAFQLGIMTWMLAQFAFTKEEQRGMFGAYVLGAFVPVVQIIMRAQSGVALGGEFAYGLTYARFGAFSEDPNLQALGYVMGIPMAWYLFATSTKWHRYLFLAYVPLAAAAVMLTGSRGGFLAILAASPIVLFTYRRIDFKGKVVAFAFVLVGTVAALTVVPDSTYDRIFRLFDYARSTQIYAETDLADADIRWEIWTEGVKAYMENPLIGIGLGSFREAIPLIGGKHHVAHSVWLSILTEFGIVGFIFYVSALIYGFTMVLRNTDSMERYLWIFLMLAWATGATFLNMEWNKMTWMVIAMLLARSSQIEHTKQASGAVQIHPAFRRRQLGGHRRRQQVGATV